MFRKLISNLPYSPSLIDQVALHIRHLKRDSSLRGVGMVVLTVTLAIQLFGPMLVSVPSVNEDKTELSHQVLGAHTPATTSLQSSLSLPSSHEENPLNPQRPWLLSYSTCMYGLASLAFIGLSAFFYARSRLMTKELNIIKKDSTNSGGF